MDEGLISLLCAIPSLFCASFIICIPGLLYLFFGYKIVTWVVNIFKKDPSGYVVSSNSSNNQSYISSVHYQNSSSTVEQTSKDRSSSYQDPYEYISTESERRINAEIERERDWYDARHYEDKDENNGTIFDSIGSIFGFGDDKYDDDDDD